MLTTLLVAIVVLAGLAVWGWWLAWRRRFPLPPPGTGAPPSPYRILWRSEFGNAVVYDGSDRQVARRMWHGATPWILLGQPAVGVLEFWHGSHRRAVRVVP